MRPLISCLEEDIARFAALQEFRILPCNLCSNQANLQRPRVKLLLSTLSSFNENAKQNMLNAMTNMRTSHLLGQTLREACGLLDPVTGQEVVNGGFWNSDEEEEPSELF